jgi:hypothetical protein
VTTARATSESAFERFLQGIEQSGRSVKRHGDGRAQVQCPGHDDHNPSLSVTRIEGSLLLHCHAGCPAEAVLDALSLTTADLYDNRRGIDYRYDNGRTVHRYANKQFAQSDTTNTPELYRLARVRAAVAADEWLWVVEGEKDVHVLATLGVTATCNPMGAGQWSGIDPSPLYGASRVVIVADRDEPGMRHAREIFASLTGHVTDLQVVQAREGKDAADHVVAGYGLEDFDPVDLGEIRASPAADPLYVDIGALIDGGLPDPPAPSVLARADGVCAFYAGEVNMLFGEPETGKTWIALVALAEVLTSGGSGLVVDLDHNGAVSTITRLLALGVPEEILIDATRFRAIGISQGSWIGPTVVAVVQIGAWLGNARRQSVGVDGPLWFVSHSQWTPPWGWWPWIALVLAGGLLLVGTAAANWRGRPAANSSAVPSSATHGSGQR